MKVLIIFLIAILSLSLVLSILNKDKIFSFISSNQEEIKSSKLFSVGTGDLGIDSSKIYKITPYYPNGTYSIYLTGNESKWVKEVIVKDNQVIVYPKELKDRIYEECSEYDGDKCIESKNITYNIPSELSADDGKTAKPPVPKTKDPKTAKDVFVYNLSGETYLKLGTGTIFVLEDMYLHTSGVENVTISEAGFTHLNASNGNSNAYYSFDMDTAAVQDYFPYEYDMVKNGYIPWTSQGKYGGAYIFNTTTVLEDETYPAPGSNNVSISAWFKTPGGLGTTRGIIARVGSGDVFQLEVNDTGGVVLQFIPSTAVQCTKTSYDYRDNQWHMATGVRRNLTSADLYVDGVFNCRIHTAPSTTLSHTGILVGMVSASSQGFNGTIDEVMVFNRSLSATEITNIYNGDFQRFNKAGIEKFAVPLADAVGYNKINISSEIHNLLDSNISLMVEYFDTEFHTSPEFYNITNLKNYTFTISTEATEINLTYTFQSNKGYYSPEHYGTIYFETFNITVEEADTAPPIVDLNVPVNNTNFTTQTVYFSANFTDDYNVSSATLWIWNINSTIINNTQFRNISGTEYGLNLSVILPYYTTYYWNYYACDNSSNCAWNSTNWSVGYAPVPDTTKPAINITYPINRTYGTNVTILNYTMIETSPDSCWYSYNLGVTNSTKTTSGTNFTISLNEGQTTLFTYCNDTSNNLGFNSTTLVQDTYPPYFTHAISNFELINGSSFEWDINATDTITGVQNYSINDSKFEINQTGWIKNISEISTALYYLNLSVNDTIGNSNSSIFYINVTVAPDTIFPLITIVYPPNSTNSTLYNLDVNYTVSDANLDSCWWSDDYGATNISTGTCGTNLSGAWVEGVNVIIIYANDTSNNENLSTVTFRIDTKPPYFTAIENITIQRNESAVYDVNATDLGVGVDCFKVNDTNFDINCTGWLTNSTGLTVNTTYWLNISVNDTLNNWNSSIIYVNVTELPSVISDTSPPYYSENFTLPVSPVTYLSGASYYFNITWIDDVLIDTGKIEFNGTNYTMSNLSAVYNYTFKDLGGGTYNYYFWSNDTSNNQNNTYMASFVINPKNSSTNLSATPNTPINYATPSNFSCFNNASLSSTLYIDGVDSSTETGLDINRSAGTYVVSCNSTGNNNITGSTNGTIYTINQITSSVFTYLNSTMRDNVTIAQYESIYLNLSRQAGEGSCILYQEEASIGTGTNFGNLTNFTTAGYFNITSICPATTNYTQSSETFYVNATFVDITHPYFINIGNLTFQENLDVHSQFNATDETAFDCFVVNDTSRFNINCSGYFTNATALGVGIYWANITINDSSNNLNSTEIYVNITSVPDTTAPYFNPIPQNTSIVYLTDTIILINATDNGIDNAGIDCYTVNDTRFSINCTGGLINVTSLGVMRYWLNISVNDSSNNWNSTYFYIDILQLGQFVTPYLNGINDNLIVTYPTQMNATHTGTNKTSLKIEINGTAIKEGVNYTIGVGFWIVNWSAPENQNYSVIEESLNITVNQGTGQADAYVNQSQIQFNATFGTTANNTYLNGTLTIGSGTINLSLNGATINTGDSPLYNISNLSSGYYNLSVIYDGNQNWTGSISTIWINVSEFVGDTVSPYFNPIPANQTFYFNSSVGFDINATDTFFDCFYINDTRFSINCSGWISNLTSLGVMPYEINITANDSSGNINETFLIVNITPSAQYFTPLLNGVESNLVIIHPQQANASYTGNNKTELGIRINGTTMKVAINYTIGSGFWQLNYTTQDNQNFSRLTKWLNLTINQATQTGILYINQTTNNFTSDNQTNGGSWNIYLNATISTPCALYNNGTSINTGSSNLFNITNFTIAGQYNISLICPETQNYSLFSTWMFANISEFITNTTLDFNPIPANQSFIFNQIVTFDINVNNATTMSYNINDTRFLINISGGITNLTQLGVMIYNLNVSINDSDGNYNETFFYVNITQANGTAYAWIDNLRSNYSSDNNTAVNIYLNATSNCIDGTLWNNRTIINSGTFPLYNLTNFTYSSEFNITAICKQNQNYTFASETWWAIISNITVGTIPSINFTFPTPDNGTTQAGNSIYVNVTSDDDTEYSVFTDFNGDLRLWLRMDERKNATYMYDNSTYGNNGTIIETPTYSAGKRGNAINLNGTGGYIHVPNKNYFYTTPISIDFWVKFNQLPADEDQGIMVMNATNPSWIIAGDPLANNIVFEARDINNIDYKIISSETTTGTWYHIVAMINSSNYTFMYMDGVKQTTCAPSCDMPSFQTADGNLLIGVTETGYLNGSIDDVKIYSRILSEQEILASYNAKVNPYYRNFTDLAYGTYNFIAYAQDLDGNVNSTETRTVIIEAEDTTPLNITIISPRAITYTTSRIDFNVSLNKKGSWCALALDDPINTTMTKFNNTYFNYTSSSVPDGVHTVIFYCNDTTGNLATAERTFAVDTIPPMITLNYPLTTSYINYLSVYMNYTPSDVSGLDTCELWGDWGTGWHKNQSDNSVVSGALHSFIVNFSDGVYIWNVWCNDTNGDSDYSAQGNQTFYIDTTSPVLNITYPSNTTYYLNVTELNYTINDLTLQSCWYSLNSGTINTTITCGDNVTGITSIIGSNIWTVWANDTLGHISNVSIIFSVVLAPTPIIDITYPEATDYKSVTELNYTVSAINLQSCWYSLNGTTNITVGCSNGANNVSGLTATEGTHTWWIWANNTDRIGSDYVTFVIDNVAPLVAINSPLNQTYNTTSEINISLDEDGDCNYTLDDGITNLTLTAHAGNTQFIGSLSVEGSYTLYAYCLDIAGNANNTEYVIFYMSIPVPLGGGVSGAGGYLPPRKKQPFIPSIVTIIKGIFNKIYSFGGIIYPKNSIIGIVFLIGLLFLLFTLFLEHRKKIKFKIKLREEWKEDET